MMIFHKTSFKKYVTFYFSYFIKFEAPRKQAYIFNVNSRRVFYVEEMWLTSRYNFFELLWLYAVSYDASAGAYV